MNGSLLDNRILTLDQATPGTGPIGPAIDKMLSPRSETYLSLDHNIRSKVDNNFKPIINAQNESSQQYINDKYVNFTGREQISPTIVEQTNLKGHEEFHNLSINNARTTNNETTLYSYAGNAQREHDGSNFYRYADTPRTTNNETTLYSYAGNVNGIETSHNQTNRVQFTGTYESFIDENGKECHFKTGDSGVTNWGQGSITLVEDYFPGSNGAVNIQLDPDEKLGFTEMKSDWDMINANGSGSYLQAIPNGENFQQISKNFIGNVEFNPNKVQSVDNRQTANYLITNLQQNDLSIYKRPELRNKILNPSFFINSNAQNYSGISTKSIPFEQLKEQKLKFGEVNVYENNKYNPNAIITTNTIGQINPNIENPLLYQSRHPNNYATFMGKGYSGNAIIANDKNSKNRILLDTDSKLSSRYLDNFSPNGCLNNQCVF